MKIRGKLGTMPGDIFTVYRKRNAPVIGERIKVKTSSDSKYSEWKEVIVDNIHPAGTVIHDEPFYFMRYL